MAEERWERLYSETLLETPYFALRSERLRLPDGAVKDPYYVLERPDAAIVFPVTDAGEVVLVGVGSRPLLDPEGEVEVRPVVLEARRGRYGAQHVPLAAAVPRLLLQLAPRRRLRFLTVLNETGG